jgi:cyclomaltodextrinase
MILLLEAVYHRPKQNWAYAYDKETIHLRLRTKRDDVQHASILYGDKYVPWDAMSEASMELMCHDELFDYWQVAVKPQYRRLCYGFVLQSGDETIWKTERGFRNEAPHEHIGLFDFPFLNPIDVFQPPAWVKNAVFYQIFPERFANGDASINPKVVENWGGKPTPANFFGGDLQGVMDHLDYLADLGITAIYFNPLFVGTTNHKYDTQDYLRVDPQFGTNETLKALVQACHAKGMRVMLDAVFNHCGRTFAPFVDVLEKGANSRYASWFHVREWPLAIKNGLPTYETFAFEPLMPKLNTEHSEVKEYLLRVAKYWIEEVGIDGWRLDVANEVDHQFWREFRSVVKQANPDVYILGELFHDAMMWLQGDQFDAVMNYPFTNAMIDFFAKDNANAAQFANAINFQLARYPLQVNEVSFNLLDSHDTRRFLTLCDNDKAKMKLAFAFQLTFLGTPCIYYGDEIGMTGGHDPDCRKCMVWEEAEQDKELHGFFRQMIALRHRYQTLRSGSFRFLYAEEQAAWLAYERFDEHEHFVIVMNAAKKQANLSIDLPSGVWCDERTKERFTVDGKQTNLKLSGFGFNILRKET